MHWNQALKFLRSPALRESVDFVREPIQLQYRSLLAGQLTRKIWNFGPHCDYAAQLACSNPLFSRNVTWNNTYLLVIPDLHVLVKVYPNYYARTIKRLVVMLSDCLPVAISGKSTVDRLNSHDVLQVNVASRP